MNYLYLLLDIINKIKLEILESNYTDDGACIYYGLYEHGELITYSNEYHIIVQQAKDMGLFD